MGITPLAPQASASASSATFAFWFGPLWTQAEQGVGSTPEPGPSASPLLAQFTLGSGQSGGNGCVRIGEDVPERLDHLTHFEGLTDPG